MNAAAAALPALTIVLNAMVWGLAWIPFRQIQLHGWHPLWTTSVVYLVLLAVMVAMRSQTARVMFRTPSLWWLALAAGLTNVGFNWGVTQGDVVRVVLLFYLMPLWIALLAWPLLGERPGPASIGRMVLALAGVVVILKAPGARWPVPSSLTDWLGLGAGFCFALTNIFLLRAARQSTGEQRALAMFLGCAGVGTVAALVGSAIGAVPTPPWHSSAGLGWALVLGAAFITANICLQYGAVRLQASVTSVIMLSEVLFASVSSVLLGASSIGPRVWLGGALILLGALWAALAPRTQAKPAPTSD